MHMIIYLIIITAIFQAVEAVKATDLIRLVYILQKRQFVVGTSKLLDFRC